MATRAATFTAKIRNLKDYHSRMVNGVTPVASGADIANTLKYFSQALLSVLKDIPLVPSESFIGLRQRDNLRLSLFPNLNYSGLYHAVKNIIDIIRLVNYGQHALGESILSVIGCLVPFLETDILDSLPYTVASTLAVFPATLHKDIILLLCTNLLPVTLGGVGVSESTTYATESTAAILMLVFQYVPSAGLILFTDDMMLLSVPSVCGTEYHSMVLECLMGLKKNVCKDLLCVIAYGPPSARIPAAHHFFFYWPQLNPSLFDRRGIHYKFFGFDFTGWKPVLCQRESCLNAGNVPAVKMCLDPTIVSECADRPPPLYLCADCANQLKTRYLVDVLQPINNVSLTCENKNCGSDDNMAVCTCYSVECASADGFRPIRYCEFCHRSKHVINAAGANHIYHLTVPSVWTNDVELQGYLVDAIVSLLKEAEPMEEKRTVEMGEERMRAMHSEDDDAGENQESDERKLLSRYGVWLLVELTTAKDDISIEVLGRLLAMLFQWFDATAYLPDDNVGNALNMLKPQYICHWLSELGQVHFEVLVSCLLPHPPEYAQVGGYNESLASRTIQVKEGLNRLLCLAPYGIISFKIWDYIMPFWLEAVRTEVPEDERSELKVLICKAFDSDMSPLSFGAEKMYNFICERFEGTSAVVQEQCLEWLQILTSLEAFIPINLLVSTCQTGVDSLSRMDKLSNSGQPEVPTDSKVTEAAKIPDTANNMKCFIMMLDILLKQTEIQGLPPHNGALNTTSQCMMGLLTSMLCTQWDGQHTSCTDTTVMMIDCPLCEQTRIWYQLATKMMQYITSAVESPIPVQDLPKLDDDMTTMKTGKTVDKERIPVEKCQKLEDLHHLYSIESSVARLPSELRLLYALLKNVNDIQDTDARYYWLNMLKQLCMNDNCLHRHDANEESFVKYCLKTLLLPSLWKLLKADNSQIAQVCVPLLIHCLTQPSGSDVFWNLVETDFTNDDWKIRFSAVEKVTVIARLLNVAVINNNQQVKTSLAHAFCCLIGSLDDTNIFVVQRTALYLETVKASSIKFLIQCLEFQFDTVISDRTMILHKLFLLHVTLKDQDILTWDLFMSRFDTLCLEAQIDLDSTADDSSLQDLQNSDHRSEKFLRKINYARFALARTDSIRSVRSSLQSLPPYRRATSTPMHLITHTASPADKEKEKSSSYGRQQSAPQFRSRGSRIGLSMFANYIFPAINVTQKAEYFLNGIIVKTGGHLREFTDGESNFAALLQRAMEMEGVDRETLHQLITLLMKFMAGCDQDRAHEDRDTSQAQKYVLKHLNILLGYNQLERKFIVPPYKLRYSAVFNAYIFGLAKVLDENFLLGNMILPMSLNLLQHCPSPQRYASDSQPPNYTLWLLEPCIRQCWLMALLVILYKYQYNAAAVSETVQTLVRVAINTVDAKIHRCKTSERICPSSPFIQRTRDASNISAGDLENIMETETPPQSPPASDTEPLVNSSILAELSSNSLLTNMQTLSDRRRRGRIGPDLSLLSTSNAMDSTVSPASSQPSSPTVVDHKVISPPPVSPLSGPRSAIGKQPTADVGPGNDLNSNGNNKSAAIMLESIRQRQQDQVARIAEYNKRDSLVVSPDLQPEPKASEDTISLVGGADQSPPLASDATTDAAEHADDKSESKQQPIETDQLQGAFVVVVDQSVSCDPAAAHSPRETTGHHGLAHSHAIEWFDQKLECVPEDAKETDEDSNNSPVKTKPQSSVVVAVGATVESPVASTVVDIGDTNKSPEHAEGDGDESPEHTPQMKPNFRQRRRKTGLVSVEPETAVLTELAQLNDLATRRTRRSEHAQQLPSQQTSQTSSSHKQRPASSSSRPAPAEAIVVEKCLKCHAVLESYDDETISLCIICLATFIHQEPALAAPLLLDMLQSVSKIVTSCQYPWQAEQSGVIIPGNPVSVARQFIRCVLHQLAPNNVFPQIFMSDLGESDLLKTIAGALTDFAELNSYTALQLLLEGVNETKVMNATQLSNVLVNLAQYLDCLVLESTSSIWTGILTQFDVFFRRLLSMMSSGAYHVDSILKIMIHVLKIPGLTSNKGILDPFSKLLSSTIQNGTFHLQQLMDICALSGRAFTKDRDKLFLPRCVVLELVQALKFKATLPDENLILLVQLVCIDAGGTMGSISIVPDLASYQYNPYSQSLVSTNLAESMRQHLTECIEFIADLHTINKVKNNLKIGGITQNLNEDTLGSHLKAGIAQFIALEFTRVGGRDNRIVNRYLPWLYHPPSAIQQGPREFVDCVGHIRILSWLLIGSLTHTAVTKAAAVTVCQPLSLEASSYISDHIMVIMTGFAEQSKASVLHMSSLFHAFTLCQLWTMYCESLAAMSPPASDAFENAHQTIMDFWGRVTPGILQLLSHSKVLAEMVNLHFLSLLEALQECNSTVLTRLFSMWVPILYSYNSQLTGHMQIRLQMVQNWQPKEVEATGCHFDCDTLLKWLKRLQFRLSQIEVQSSAATQFYTV